MRIEKEGEYWIIVRGKDRKESYFRMFVDSDRMGWTTRQPWNAQKYKDKALAESAIDELRRRAKHRKYAL